jgi:hypothetical protein
MQKASSWPPIRRGCFRGVFVVYFEGFFVGPGDKVGNLKRGGSLERDKPIPVSEHPEG